MRWHTNGRLPLIAVSMPRLRSEQSRVRYAAVNDLPSFSPHGHVAPALPAGDPKPREAPVDLRLTPDHYVFRMLYRRSTVSLAPRSFPDLSSATNRGASFALSALSLLPAIDLLLLFQKHLVQSIRTPGLKGDTGAHDQGRRDARNAVGWGYTAPLRDRAALAP